METKKVLKYPEDWEDIAKSLDFVEPEQREGLLQALLLIMLRS